MKDDAQVALLQEDYRGAKLDAATRAMLDFAVRLTTQPRHMRREDVDRLRTAGFSDAAILDVVQTTAYFNYANRVMDALGIELELEMVEKR